MYEFFNNLLEILEKVVPAAVVAGGGVYALMKGSLKKERREHNKAKVENELLRGEIDVKIELENKSDFDVVRDAINDFKGGDKSSETES